MHTEENIHPNDSWVHNTVELASFLCKLVAGSCDFYWL